MNILLIDTSVKDYEIVVNSCNSNTRPILYSYNNTKQDIKIMIDSNISIPIERIGIFADSAATLFLDNQTFFIDKDIELDSNEKFEYSNNFQFIIELIEQYDISYIDFLACNSLNNPDWVKYYTKLIMFTNVIIGASNNATGNIQYGGDWIMESNAQDIEFIYFTQNIEYYKYLLVASTTINNFFFICFYYKNIFL